MTRRRRRIIAIGAVLVLTCTVWWFRTPSVQERQPVWFIGLTNSVFGSNAAAFSSESTKHAAFVSRWSTAGSNAAVFTLSNRETCTIKIFACSFQTRGEQATEEQTFALDSPFTYGFYLLQPSQTVTSHIAVIAYPDPWRIAFFYYRHDWREQLRALWATLRRAPPIQLQTHVFYSDWIDQ